MQDPAARTALRPVVCLAITSKYADKLLLKNSIGVRIRGLRLRIIPKHDVALTAPALRTITIARAAPTIQISVSPKLQLTATDKFSDGSTQDLTTTATWTSSRTSVATVVSGGFATGIARGTTNITAKSGAIAGNATLTVSP